jgi:DNA repair protein SbcC/Rad50
MAYKISSVEMEGIRGINKPASIVFNEGLTIIHGPNGTGKSSILQAVEWGITGDIPYMKRGDFAKEDAIVNAFVRSKKARVKLSFSGPQNITLTRSKNRTRSTSSGKQNLILDADKSYQDDDAVAYLEQTFDFDLDEVSRSKFLHQETIRAALTYSPSQRSAVIEKLLGTYEIKEFTKALDQKRKFNSEIKAIDTRIDALQRDRIQFIINLRRSLEELETGLLGKGYKEHELDLAFSLREIEEIRKTLDTLAASYEGITIVHPDIAPRVDSLLNANKRVLEDVTVLDRKRMQKLQASQKSITRIEMLAGAYDSALNSFKDYETLDIEGLEKQKKEVETQVAEIKEIYDKKQRVLTRLPSRISIYESEKNGLKTEKETLEKSLVEYGDEPQLTELITKSKEKLEETKKELAKYSGQQRIVNLAANLIESTQEDQCPVCSQSINPGNLVSELKSKVSNDISEIISNLNKNQSEENHLIEKRTQQIATLQRIRETIDGLEPKVLKAKEELEKILGEISEQTDLSSVTDEIESQVQEHREKLSKLEGLFRELDDKIRQFNYLNKEISDNREKLQSELATVVEGRELIQAAERILLELNKVMDELGKTSDIDILRERQGRLSEILAFLEDKDRTENAEKELPALEEQKNELTSRKTGLLLLDGALSSIRDILTSYQKETSIQQIRNLEEMMNETYQAIQGHPYFSRLKIDIEKEDPLQFSFRAASDKEITYIPTRFSTAQLNIAALSIFVSNSKLMSGELPLIILDDPTQNMDSVHKEAFAGFVSGLKEDFQVVIATEDDETRDYLLQSCTDATCNEIHGWDTEGPILS